MLVDAARWGNVVVRKVVPQRRHIQLQWEPPHPLDGVELGGKHQLLPIPAVVERLDAEPIAHQIQALLLLVPKCKGEHAAQELHAPDAEELVQRQDDLRIAAAAEAPSPLLCLLAQLGVVVNLPVEHDAAPPRGAVHGLCGSITQINDCQAAMRKSQLAPRVHPDPLTIGSAMAQRFAQRLEFGFLHRRFATPYSGNSAHQGSATTPSRTAHRAPVTCGRLPVSCAIRRYAR
jgi:hypothetical protein